jgi:polynucleotide 5'-hydroxyl-kinase GRC3/NOL9
VADAIVDAPGIVMMLGAVDMGKTTTATRLAGAAVRAGVPAAVVDADTGQSDLGPPAAIGWGPVREPVRHMADIPLAGLWFAGDTSPQQVYRYVVDGTLALTARARRQGAQMVVIDTTGWVEGEGAVAAKLRKIRRLAPRHLVAIQRDREVEPILAHVPRTTTVHRLRPAPAVRSRSAQERREFRAQKFAGYFAGSGPLWLDMCRIIPQRSAVYMGRSIPPARVFPDVPPDALRHLLVGLADRRGTIMAMGTVAEVDPVLHRLSVVAPMQRPVRPVRLLEWGILRVTPEGREDGRLSDPGVVFP